MQLSPSKFPALCGSLILLLAGNASAAEYYVATTGNDSNPGTIEQPFATLQKGHDVAAAGDTVWIRGGTYRVVNGASATSGFVMSKSGQSDARRIKFWAYPGELPIFDFSQLRLTASMNNSGFYITGSWLHFKGFEVANVPMGTRSSNGMWNRGGSNNTFELLNIHHITGAGLSIANGNGGHLALNCDSHDNYDPNSDQGDGQNADGFGVHYQETGTITVLRGCRAWWNSDDGYDLISQEVPVTIDNCWATGNGYINSGAGRPADGNGNGFKAGSSKTGIRHVIRNSLAWGNRASGFYANHSSGGNDWFNNTAYMNGTQYNMLASPPDDSSVTIILTGALAHKMRNNIGFPNKNSNMGGVDTMFNTWDLNITPASGDFASVSDTNVIMGPRKADGSLPDVSFMHLAANSQLINKGTDVGLPFVGSAPDLGAFEYGAVTTGSGGTGGAGTGGSGGSGGSSGGRGGAAGGGAGRGGSSGAGGVAGAAGRGGAGGATAGAGGSSGASGVAGVGGGVAGTGGATGVAGAAGMGGAATGGAGTTGGATTGGSGAGGGGGATTPPDDPASGGCACAIDANAGDASLASLLFALAVGLIVARRGARPMRIPLWLVLAATLALAATACDPAAPGNVDADGGPGGNGGSGPGGGAIAGNGGAAAGGAAGAAGGSAGATAGTTGLGGSGGDGGAAASAGGGGRGGAAGLAGGGGRGGSAATAGQGGTAQAGSGGTASTAAVIINDRFWRDTSGTPIYSQGGGVLQVGATYYWYGVKYGGAVAYAANPAGGKIDDTSFAGITIYSSTNLVDWKLENTVRPANTGGWFGRLGVVYHAATRKYVLVAQGGGGLYFATSDTPNGTFVFNNVQTNLPGIVNGSTGDQTTFQDDDGKAYLISSSSMGRANLYVSPLRASDYLAVETGVRIYRGAGREGNCMFKHEGTYTFCSSDLHGWNASQSYCMSATNITGPYSAEFVMEGTSADFSHVTQTGFFISVKGTTQNTIIFAGDRWSDFAGNGLGYNQWMPLTFTGSTPRMESLSHWSINTATGAWSVDARNNYALNPSFEADRVAMTQPTGWTTSNGTNVQTPHTGRWGWQLTGTSTLTQAIAGLPDGTYTLSMWVRASAAGAQLYARGFGGTDRTTSIASATAWTNVTLTGITVSNGRCEVGITTSGQTLTVDDFVLSRG